MVRFGTTGSKTVGPLRPAQAVDGTSASLAGGAEADRRPSTRPSRAPLVPARPLWISIANTANDQSGRAFAGKGPDPGSRLAQRARLDRALAKMDTAVERGSWAAEQRLLCRDRAWP